MKIEKEEINSILLILESQGSTKIESYNLDKYKVLESDRLLKIITNASNSTANITTEGREYIKNLLHQ